VTFVLNCAGEKEKRLLTLKSLSIVFIELRLVAGEGFEPSAFGL
jgi:hypothetical protein